MIPVRIDLTNCKIMMLPSDRSIDRWTSEINIILSCHWSALEVSFAKSHELKQLGNLCQKPQVK
jgi:hypothetical protein